jgi:uncharacterized protein (DUF3084 family)
MEESVATGEQLAKELQLARTEAAVNKEETRGVRKRLAGCHFHYKELQQHYNELLQQSEEQERRLAKAEKHDALHSSQAESWVASMGKVRERRRAADEKVESLCKENEELQQKCNELEAEVSASEFLEKENYELQQKCEQLEAEMNAVDTLTKENEELQQKCQQLKAEIMIMPAEA